MDKAIATPLHPVPPVTETGRQPRIGNPNVFALCAFGFSLLMLGVELTFAHAAAGAAAYGVLFAGALELIAGMWLIAKGESYLASIVTLFGAWLLGYFLYLTQGKGLGHVNPAGTATYLLALLPPVAFLAIPAFKWRRGVLSAAFVSLFLLVLALGLSAALGSEPLKLAAGLFAFVAMFFIWWLAVRNVLELLHEP
jgi:succinate-acetate transporter protein